MAKKELRIRYDNNAHDNLAWAEYSPGDKLERGYYTVVCSIRNHWWIYHGYFFNGTQWVASRNSLTKSVIKYLPDSRRSDYLMRWPDAGN